MITWSTAPFSSIWVNETQEEREPRPPVRVEEPVPISRRIPDVEGANLLGAGPLGVEDPGQQESQRSVAVDGKVEHRLGDQALGVLTVLQEGLDDVEGARPHAPVERREGRVPLNPGASRSRSQNVTRRPIAV